MLILIAGPYRSGTGGDPALMAADLAALAPERGLPVYTRLQDVPGVTVQAAA